MKSDAEGTPMGSWVTTATRRRPRRFAVALFAFAVCCTSPASESAADPLKALTERYQRDRKRLIAENLLLMESEARRFWPLYEQYEKELSVLVGKRRALITDFGENYDLMTDAMAKKIMIEQLALEEERDRLRRTYVHRFEKVLPVKKLARYLQIEAKIRAAVDAGIAEELPLIK